MKKERFTGIGRLKTISGGEDNDQRWQYGSLEIF